jgi:hypothetical protein
VIRIAAVALSTALLATSAVHAQDIDIKGLKLGMNQYEVAAVMPDPRHFTIADVPPLYPPALEYRDMRLTSFIWFFNPGSYETVRDAFLAKYPVLKCTQSELQNGFGATFPQEQCRLGLLVVERYTGSTDVGSVYLAVPVPTPPASKDL